MKYTTLTLYKSAVHKQDKSRETRRRLAQKLQAERLARRLIKGLTQ